MAKSNKRGGESSRTAAASAPAPASKRRRRPTVKSAVSSAVVSEYVYAVQCEQCLKWRIMPSMEQYDKIKSKIEEIPFTCETNRTNRRRGSCADPADIEYDCTRAWIMDKPGLPKTAYGVPDYSNEPNI